MPHKRIERAAKREPLREKEDSQERVVHGEENRKERIKCYCLWDKWLICVRVKKNKRDFLLALRHTQ